MIGLGMFIYALGVGSVALMSSFWGFWASMVIITLGELIFVPTASGFVANRAPQALRGRYMSFYWLTWSLARALAPVLGGTLHDQIAPKAIWQGGLVFGLLSALGFAAMGAQENLRQVFLHHQAGPGKRRPPAGKPPHFAVSQPGVKALRAQVAAQHLQAGTG